MTDKELRRLRRDDLLQILINQQKQIDALNEQLQQSKEALANRDIAIQEAGSLAEAALKMNGVFESAQNAAEEYVRQMHKRADALVAEAEKRSSEAQINADNLLRNARSEAERILSQARSEADSMARQAQVAGQGQQSAVEEAVKNEDDKRRRWRIWGNKGT
jgi:enamine deaminase RidA (YjgF/YER057c/UK114 family)